MALEDVEPIDEMSADLDIIGDGETKSDEKPEEKPDDSDDEDVEKESEDTEETDDDEEKEESEEEEEEEKESEDEDEDEEDPDASEAGRLEVSKIAKEYPGIFKKYPELRAAYFRDQKFAEFFPTLQDADVAARKARALDVVDSELANGKVESLLKVASEEYPKQLRKIAENILPELYKIDKSLYHEALQPALANVLRVALAQAEKSGNENLKHSVNHLANFIFGDPRIPDSKKDEPEENEETKAAKTREQQVLAERHREYSLDINDKIRSRLRIEATRGLDPKGEMTDFVKGKIVDDIIDEIDRLLGNDGKHMAVMNSLWQQITKSGYSGDLKPRLISAYLGRAKNLLPQIRQRKLREASGKKPTKLGEERKKETKQPSGGGIPKSKSKVISVKEAKEKNLSDMDIILGNY